VQPITPKGYVIPMATPASDLSAPFTRSATAAAESPSAEDGLAIERLEGGLLLIGIDRPGAGNLIDPATFLALARAYDAFEQDDALRVAVLHGRGADFCAGIDAPAWAEALKSGPVIKKGDPGIIQPLGIFAPFRSKPVVVAVQGATQHLGHELFLAADIRVAADDTVFKQDEAVLGLVASQGGTIRFAREAGWSNAMRYLLTGDSWGVEEAFRFGLVHAVTEPRQQLDRAVALARRVAAAAPLGVRATLASASASFIRDDEAVYTGMLLPEFQRLQRSEDRQEYVRARKEGRAPVYRGG
jgi:enoyl-CoA hydratase/carnithine racemase